MNEYQPYEAIYYAISTGTLGPLLLVMEYYILFITGPNLRIKIKGQG